MERSRISDGATDSVGAINLSAGGCGQGIKISGKRRAIERAGEKHVHASIRLNEAGESGVDGAEAAGERQISIEVTGVREGRDIHVDIKRAGHAVIRAGIAESDPRER